MERYYKQKYKRLKFDLYLSKYSNSDSFHSQLFKLIGKADINNRKQLRIAFPIHVKVWEDWYYNENEKEFFKEMI